MKFAYIAFTDTQEEGKSKSFAKEKIRDGFIVDGPRQCGKTEALLEVIHEDTSGVATIIVPSSHEGGIYLQRYRRLFPKDKIPVFISSIRGRVEALSGRARIYVDGYGRLYESDIQALRESPAEICGVY